MEQEKLPLFPGLMVKLFGPNWKSGVGGTFGFLGGLIATGNTLAPHVVGHQDQLVALAGAVCTAVAGWGLYMAKDHDVAGVQK